MTRQRRRGQIPGASSLFGATPAIVLIVSTQAGGPARAQEDDGPPADPENAAGTAGGPAVRDPLAPVVAPGTDPAADAATGRLVVPLDLDEASDSAFVRRLLLSHGIELDLGEDGVLDRTAFIALVTRLQAEGAGALVGADGAGLDVELVPDEAFDLTLALDVDEELSHFSADRGPGLGGWRRQRFLLEGVVLPVPGAAEPEPAAAVPEVGAAPQASPDGPPVDPVTVSDVADCPVPQALIDGFASTLDGREPSDDDEALHARLHDALEAALEPVARAPLANGASEAWRTRWLECDIVLPTPSVDESPAPPDAALIAPEPVPGESDGIDGAPDGGVLLPVEEPGGPVSDPFAPITDDSPSPSAPGIERGDAKARDGGGTSFSVSDEAPPGFESLEGPLTQFVDVYFNGRQRGSSTVTVTIDELVLDTPEEVVSMLGGITDEAQVLTALSGTLSTNADRLCLIEGDPPGCGTVDTDSAAVLYDESALRLDVFLASRLQNVVEFARRRHVPPPEGRLSAIASLGLVASSVEEGEDALDANGALIVGHGPTHLRARADYTSRGDASRLRELRLTRYAGDYEIGVGSFAFSPGLGLFDADVLGASIATSWDTRLDRESLFAGEVVVYLTRRSIVRLLIDGRVYHGASYEPGNRAVDTSALPNGTYDLTILVVGDDGSTREETRLYTKGAQLPPVGETVFGATLGVPLSFDDRTADPALPGAVAGADPSTLGDDRFLPRADDTPVLGLSVARRFGEHAAWRTGLVQVGDVSVGQLGYLGFGQRFSIDLGLSAGGRGVLAVQAGAGVRAANWSFGVSHASSRSSFGPGDDPVFTRFFPSDADQTYLSAGRSFGSLQLGARVSRRSNRTDAASAPERQYVLSARHPLPLGRRLRGSVSLEWRRDEVEQRIGAQLRINAAGPRGSASAYVGGNRRRVSGVTDDGVYPVAGASVATPTRAIGTTRWNAGANVAAGRDTRNAGVSVRAVHPWAAFGASTNWSFGGSGGAVRSSVASASAQLGIDGSGAAIGGTENARSGVIVDVDGEPAGDDFDIRIGNFTVGTGTVGRPSFIALEPFQSYSVRLVTRSLMSNGIGEDVHDFTLYPGSVERLEVRAIREVLLVASLVDERGRPVVDATIETRRGPALIDASGIFQAELSPGTTALVRRDGAIVCEFEVPGPADGEEIVIPESPVRCRTVVDGTAGPELGAAAPGDEAGGGTPAE